MLVLLTTNVLDQFKKVEGIINALYISCFISGLLGILGIGTETSSKLLTLSGQGAKEYAAYIGIVFIISTVHIFYGNVRYKLLNSMIAIVSIIPLISTGERGVILALLIGWLSIILVAYRKGRYIPAFIGVLGALYIAPTLMYELGWINKYIANRFTLISIIESEGSGRLDIWRTGLVLARENWLIGVGMGNFTYVIQYFWEKVIITARLPYNVDPHGDWLSILGELGLVGLLLFGVFLKRIFSNLLQMFKIYNIEGKTLPAYAVMIVGLFVFMVSIGLTSTFMYRKIYWLILALAITLPNLFNDNQNPSRIDV